MIWVIDSCYNKKRNQQQSKTVLIQIKQHI